MRIQDTWPSVKLEDVIQDMQPGFAQRPNSENEGTPQLRTNNVSSDGRIDLSEVKYVTATKAALKKYGVRPGDVIFNNTNSPELVGKTAYFDLDETYVISNHMTRLRTNSDLMDAEFLAHYLHYLWQIGISSRWAKHWVNQAAIDQSGLAQFPVPVPPLPEQVRIVAILRQADELRRLRQEAREKADGLLAAVFYETFGDPARNPKGWERKKLSKVGKLDRGKSRHRPRDASHLYDGQYPFIQTGDVANSNGWITEYSQTYSEAGLEQSRLWDAGTLCITIAANIAKTGILTFDACFPDSVVGFTPYDEVTVEYVHQWFVAIQNRLEEIAPQAAQKNINLGILRNLTIPVPPKPLIEQFTSYVEETQETFIEQEKSRKQLEKLFEAVLARAFSGELTTVYRDQHQAELQEAAAQRDIALGLRGEKPRLIDFTEGRVTPAEEEQFRQSVQKAFKPAIQDLLASLGTSNVFESLARQINFPSFADLIRPALPTYENLVGDILADSVASTSEVVRTSLANNFSGIIAESIAPLTESIRLSNEAFYKSLGQNIMALAEAQVRQAVQQEPPQSDRAVHAELDSNARMILQAVQALPTYFTPLDLHQLILTYSQRFDGYQQLDLVQVETALNLLETLGFIRQVVVDERLVFRLVNPVEDGALLPEELAG